MPRSIRKAADRFLDVHVSVRVCRGVRLGRARCGSIKSQNLLALGWIPRTFRKPRKVRQPQLWRCRLWKIKGGPAPDCIFIHGSGVVPRAAVSRMAMAAEIPALLMSTGASSVTRIRKRWGWFVPSTLPQVCAMFLSPFQGWFSDFSFTQGLRPGLHSVAASRLGPGASPGFSFESGNQAL
jgi:hypothetical protein